MSTLNKEGLRNALNGHAVTREDRIVKVTIGTKQLGIRLRALTAGESFGLMLTATGGLSEIERADASAQIVRLAAVDEEGTQLFGGKDGLELFNSLPVGVVSELWAAAMEMSGFIADEKALGELEDDLEAREKNCFSTPS